jgi:ABC-type uncharacterized transport system permease subunit
MNTYWLALALTCYALSAASFVRFRMPVIGLYVMPIAILALLMSTSMVRNAHLTMPQSLGSAWLATHLTFALLSFALFVLAAAVTLVYVVHERRLKAKRSIDDSRPSRGGC